MKKYRCQTKTAKLTNLLFVIFTTFSFCVIFAVEVYTVLIKVYAVFFLEKVDGSENSRLLNGVQNGPADNVTGAVRNDRCLPEHKLRVLFAIGQWHRPPRSVGTHTMSQPAAVATRRFLHFTR